MELLKHCQSSTAATPPKRKHRRRIACNLTEDEISIVIRWAKFFASHPGYSPADYDDFVQEGVIGLIRAKELYDPSRGMDFGVYAAFWIRQKIIRYRLRLKRHAKAIERSQPLHQGVEVSSSHTDGMLSAIAKEKTSILMAAIDGLGPRSSDIIRSRYGIQAEKRPLRELALRWSISSQRVTQLEKKALSRLQKILPEGLFQ